MEKQFHLFFLLLFFLLPFLLLLLSSPQVSTKLCLTVTQNSVSVLLLCQRYHCDWIGLVLLGTESVGEERSHIQLRACLHRGLSRGSECWRRRGPCPCHMTCRYCVPCVSHPPRGGHTEEYIGIHGTDTRHN